MAAPGSYLVALTVTVNRAVALLSLVFTAEHCTRVLPSLKRLADQGTHDTERAPSLRPGQ